MIPVPANKTNLELKHTIAALPPLKDVTHGLELVSGAVYLGTVIDDGLPLLLNAYDPLPSAFFIFGKPNIYNIILANRKLGCDVELFHITDNDFDSDRAKEIISSLLFWCKLKSESRSLVVFVENILGIEADPQMQWEFIRCLELAKNSCIKFILAGNTYNTEIWAKYFQNTYTEEYNNIFSFYENKKKFYFYIPKSD